MKTNVTLNTTQTQQTSVWNPASQRPKDHAGDKDALGIAFGAFDKREGWAVLVGDDFIPAKVSCWIPIPIPTH